MMGIWDHFIVQVADTHGAGTRYRGVTGIREKHNAENENEVSLEEDGRQHQNIYKSGRLKCINIRLIRKL